MDGVQRVQERLRDLHRERHRGRGRDLPGDRRVLVPRGLAHGLELPPLPLLITTRRGERPSGGGEGLDKTNFRKQTQNLYCFITVFLVVQNSGDSFISQCKARFSNLIW